MKNSIFLQDYEFFHKNLTESITISTANTCRALSPLSPFSIAVNHSSDTYRLGLIKTSEAGIPSLHLISNQRDKEYITKLVDVKERPRLDEYRHHLQPKIEQMLHRHPSLASVTWKSAEVDDSKLDWILYLGDEMAKWTNLRTQTTMMQEFTDVVCRHDDRGAAVVYSHLCCTVGDSLEISVRSATSTHLDRLGESVPSRKWLANGFHRKFKENARPVVEAFAARHKYSKNQDSELSDQLLTKLQESTHKIVASANMGGCSVKYIAVSNSTFVVLDKYLDFETWG